MGTSKDHAVGIPLLGKSTHTSTARENQRCKGNAGWFGPRVCAKGLDEGFGGDLGGRLNKALLLLLRMGTSMDGALYGIDRENSAWFDPVRPDPTPPSTLVPPLFIP